MENTLIEWDELSYQIEQAKDFDHIQALLDKLKAFQAIAKQTKQSLQTQNKIAKYRLKLERSKGNWLNTNVPHGGGFRGNKHVSTKVDGINLSNLEINKNESANSRRIAEMPEELFNEIIQETVSKDKELTNSIILDAAKKHERTKLREEAAEAGKQKEINIDFRHGDFEEVLSDIPDGSIDCIITDPPYPYEFIECWTKLSRFAAKKLKPHGFCIAYSGEKNLPEVLSRMQESLNYYWTFCLYHTGANTTQIVTSVNIMCHWKPILIFQNGFKKLDTVLRDYVVSEQREKQSHQWQQSASGVSALMDMFTKPGDVICDPFAGSGTTIKVATEKQRTIIAAEINEDTYNIAKNNLYEQWSQTAL